MTTSDNPSGAEDSGRPAPDGDPRHLLLRPGEPESGEWAAQWEVDEYLEGMTRSKRWSYYYFGEATQPDAIAIVRRWTLVADVVVLWGMDLAAAWRTPLSADCDPLLPGSVVWHYLGNARHTLRAMVTLDWDGPIPEPYEPPPECGVPESRRRPYTLRPPQ